MTAVVSSLQPGWWPAAWLAVEGPGLPDVSNTVCCSIYCVLAQARAVLSTEMCTDGWGAGTGIEVRC